MSRVVDWQKEYEGALQRMADDERDQVKLLGDRIGYGRTIQLAEQLWAEMLPGGVDPSSNARKSLEAEVERLRGEVIKARVDKVNSDRSGENRELLGRVAKLEAENAELRAAIVDWQCSDTNLTDEVKTLKARLAWFEEAWKWVERALREVRREPEEQDHFAIREMVVDLREWVAEHPKPKP